MRHSLTAALVAVVALVACGGASDEDQAKETVEQFFTALDKRDTAKLCDDLLTKEFIERTTLATGDRAAKECRREFSRLKVADIKLDKVEKVEVDGDKATVRAAIERSGQTQPQVLRLEKEDGDWRLSGSGAQ